MAITRFEDFLCWRLSHELKCEVLAFTDKPPASRDFKFREDVRSSAASAPSNISEGYGRFRPAEFARFLEFACGSLSETINHLGDARDRKYIDDRLYSRLSNLAKAALRTTTGLLLQKQAQAKREEEEKRRRDQRERRSRKGS